MTLAKTLLRYLITIIIASIIIFLLIRVIPGDPAAVALGVTATPEATAQLQSQLGTDKPLVVQYLLYLAKLVQGDLGTNFYNNTVVSELAVRYPTTLKLALIALAFEAVVGIAAGVLAGIRKGRFIDNLVTVSTLVVISVPVFVIGGVAQFTVLKTGLNSVFPVTATQGTWQQLLMPGMVLGSLSVAYVARLTRTNLVENLRADYVRTAKAKGLSNSRTISVHALRNSLIPVITFMGYDFGALMGGAIVTERIFNINGIGGFIFRSINQRDGVSVVGAVTCLVLVYLLMNLIVDVLYSVLDPRISHD